MFHYIELTKVWSLLEYDKFNPLYFSSSLFLFLFLGLLFAITVFSNSRARVYILLLFSAFFFYKNSGTALYVLVLSSLLNFGVGYVLHNAKAEGMRKLYLWIGIILNLAALGYYKYTNFFLRTVADFQGKEFEALDIIVPLGISFFTFKALSYLFDIYYETYTPTRNFADFLLYMAYFGNISAGPIDRAPAFIEQARNYSVTREDISRGVFLIILGLIKKNVIADYIGLNYVDRIFDDPLRYTGVENLIGIYGYALQIYCDFSGYTDMALGVSLLLGFKLMENFNYPYKAKSVAEFWRRWHMSLSAWLLEYLFTPLQMGMRNMRMLGNALALLITFILCGLWHGPSWNFVIWGGLHGLFMVVGIVTNKPRTAIIKKLNLTNSKFLGFFRILFTFHLVAFAWVFFRAHDLKIIADMYSQMVNFFKPGVFPQFLQSYQMISVLIGIGYLLHFMPEKLSAAAYKVVGKAPLIVQAFLLAFAIWFSWQFMAADIQPFIYFQF